MEWTVFTVLEDGTSRHYGTYPARYAADEACTRLQDRGVAHGDCPRAAWDLHTAQAL